MRTITKLIALIALLPAVAFCQTANDIVFAMSFNFGDSNLMWNSQVDGGFTGTETTNISPEGLRYFGSNGLATNHSTDELFAVMRRDIDGNPDAARNLVLINKLTGIQTVRGLIRENTISETPLYIEGIAFNSSGTTLYAATGTANGVTAQSQRLYTVDPQTGLATEICDFSADPETNGPENSSTTIAWNPNDSHLYRISYRDLALVDDLRRIQKINPSTCAIVDSFTINTALSQSIHAMTWSPFHDKFLVHSRLTAYTVDPLTQATVTLGSSGSWHGGIALVSGVSPAPDCQDLLTAPPGEVAPCNVDASCYFSIGQINDSLGDSIENLTEFPTGTDFPCSSGSQAAQSHYDRYRKPMGSVNSPRNARTDIDPGFPGYLSPQPPTLPPEFPAVVSTRNISGRINVEATISDGHFYVQRFGSERMVLQVIDDDDTSFASQTEIMNFDGGAERQHAEHFINLGTGVGGAGMDIEADLNFDITYVPGFGSDNGFYLDHFGLRAGPGGFGGGGFRIDDDDTGADDDIRVLQSIARIPFTVFQVGVNGSSRNNGAEVATEYRKTGQAHKNFNYRIGNNPFVLAEEPDMPGVLGKAPVGNLDSTEVLNITFNLPRTIQEAWIYFTSYGKLASKIVLDGLHIDTVKPTETAQMTQYAAYVQELQAGQHTITLTADDTRLIDSIALVDRSASLSSTLPEPQAPRIKRARLRGKRLRMTIEDSAPSGCALRIFGGDTKATTNTLLAELTPTRSLRRFRTRVKKRRKQRRYFLSLTKSCTGMRFVASETRGVRARKRRR